MKITACMIVKNEQGNLAKCLTSVLPIVDEIVIVDTGSTDDTIKIAESFGAKIYHHPWQNDFSLHRNQAISYATGDWLLIVDADEEVILKKSMTKRKLKNWLTGLQGLPNNPEGVLVKMTDLSGSGVEMMTCHSARLFKNGHIHYINPVHNQPMFNEPGIFCDAFVINHYGYGLSKEKMQAKFKRIESMLLKEYEEHPDNLQTNFYLSQVYGQFGYDEKCVEWGEKYIALRDQLEPRFNWSIYFSLIKTYHKMGNMYKAYQLIKQCLKENPTDPDICYALSDHGAILKNKMLMAEGSRRFIDGYYRSYVDPLYRGVKFHFTLRPDFLVNSLYRLFIASLEEVKETWDRLKPMIQYMSCDTQLELMSNLQEIGVNEFTKKCKKIINKSVEDNPNG